MISRRGGCKFEAGGISLASSSFRRQPAMITKMIAAIKKYGQAVTSMCTQKITMIAAMINCKTGQTHDRSMSFGTRVVV